jgi:hypothetical protein
MLLSDEDKLILIQKKIMAERPKRLYPITFWSNFWSSLLLEFNGSVRRCKLIIEIRIKEK